MNEKNSLTIKETFALAVQNHKKNNFKIAEKLYKKAYAIIPKDDQLRKNYSILLLANQRFKEAWDFFEGRIGLNEFSFNNRFLRISWFRIS